MKRLILFSIFIFLTVFGLNAQNIVANYDGPSTHASDGGRHSLTNHSNHDQSFLLYGVQLVEYQYDRGAQSQNIPTEESRNLYVALELVGGESIFSNINIKLVIEQIYGMVRVGFSSFESVFLYSYGLGIGTKINLLLKHSISIDLSGNQINYNFDDSFDLNLLNKLDLIYKFHFTDRFSILIGPSYNVYITNEVLNGAFGTINVPYTIIENESSDSRIFQWIGFNAGVSIQL